MLKSVARTWMCQRCAVLHVWDTSCISRVAHVVCLCTACDVSGFICAYPLVCVNTFCYMYIPFDLRKDRLLGVQTRNTAHVCICQNTQVPYMVAMLQDTGPYARIVYGT